MINNIKFKGRTIFSRDSKKIGINGENEQEMLIFSFDNFHEGTCYLEILFSNNNKVFIELEQENETYILEVKNSLLSQVGNLKMQLTIVNTGNTVWKSEIFEMMVLTAINATETIEEDYPNFVETTTARLLEITGELLEKANISDIPTKNSELENDSGYLSEYTETDPTVPNYVKNISQEDISDWNNKSDFSGSYNDLTDKPTIPDVSNFITKSVDDLVNYYKKSETYTQIEINQRISAIPKFAIEVVNSLPTQDISATTIYLLVTGSESQNLYTEYIYVNNAWEKLGTQTVDLTGYATESWVNNQIADFLTATQINSLLADKVDKVTGKGLSTEDYTTAEKTKLSGIESEANKTIVDSALSSSSTNPVQNKKVKEAIDELNQTLLNQIPTGTAEGDSITINDSSDLPVKDVRLNGRTEQVSKNLFDGQLELGQYNATGGAKMADNALYRNVNPVKVKANTTYTTSINGVAQQYVMFFYDKNKTYLSAADNRTGTFTTPNNTGYLCFRCYMVDYTSNFENLKVQVEEGTIATSYVTYLPEPEYPQTIHRVTGECSVKKIGKNLYNATKSETVENGFSISGDAQYLYINGTANFDNKHEFGSTILKAGTYKFNIEYVSGTMPDSTMQISLYKTGTWTRLSLGSYPYLNCGPGNKQASGTFTLSEDTEVSIGFFVPTNFAASNIKFIYQIVKGSIADYEFELYQGATYPLTLGNMELCKIGDYEDYIYKSGGKWYLYKIIEKYVFDGTENFNNTYGTNLFGVDYIFRNKTNINSMAICSHYKYNSIQSGLDANTQNGEFALQKGPGSVFFKDTRYSIVNDFKNWLSNNNVTLYYILANPTITEITDTTFINQLEALINAETYKNITNIDSTGEDLAPNVQVVYRKDLETMFNKLDSLESRIALLEA